MSETEDQRSYRVMCEEVDALVREREGAEVPPTARYRRHFMVLDRRDALRRRKRAKKARDR